MNTPTTELTYDEPIPAERCRFAEMIAELNRTGVQYKTRRAHGLLVIEILIGAY